VAGVTDTDRTLGDIVRQGWRVSFAQWVAMVTVATACDPPSTISIDPASTRSTPVFTLSGGMETSPAAITAFRIDACAARGSPAPESHWLAMAPDTAEVILYITYGVPPSGWRSVQGPQPMVTGCYRAAVASAPPLEFDVLPDGNVKARR